jgi:hypothetical protein
VVRPLVSKAIALFAEAVHHGLSSRASARRSRRRLPALDENTRMPECCHCSCCDTVSQDVHDKGALRHWPLFEFLMSKADRRDDNLVLEPDFPGNLIDDVIHVLVIPIEDNTNVQI